MVKVINISSKLELKNDDICFVENVFQYAERVTKIWKEENTLSGLMKNIPVFLLNPNDMPIRAVYEDEEYTTRHNGSFILRENKNKNLNNVSEEPDKIKITEYLGFYTRENCSYLKNMPSIFLCPERIWESSKIVGYQPLLAKVIVHEFAHAIMDLDNQNSEIDCGSKFFRWVEEPFANWFVLKYLHAYGNGSVFHKIRDFIENQPINYMLGNDFFDAKLDHTYWQKWIKFKRGINLEKENWEEAMKCINFPGNVGSGSINIKDYLNKLIPKEN
jgi:hypothetical protein